MFSLDVRLSKLSCRRVLDWYWLVGRCGGRALGWYGGLVVWWIGRWECGGLVGGRVCVCVCV